MLNHRFVSSEIEVIASGGTSSDVGVRSLHVAYRSGQFSSSGKAIVRHFGFSRDLARLRTVIRTVRA
jgi:hypothetical protein